ncbi:MAG TPA: helix-turn-helix domain-containing protein, partial [Usitatibacter sp.]|nr:helix-turn-helix domain-containing protein [Usitatibacter sp.]
MTATQRAIALEDKEERGNAILDAAEALYLEHPDRIASVAEVAHAAGLAKGTVYLYFPSKEEMLLALHERHVRAFFAHLVKLL